MIRSVAVKYAFRSLRRHTRRTILSVIGVGIGGAMGLIATSWVSGGGDMQIRAASESGAGHLRIVPAAWPQTRENSLRLTDWRTALAAVESRSDVRAVAVRARASGLLAFGNRTAGVEMVGVLPRGEQDSNRIVYKAHIEGRYLQDGDESKVVIGRTLAERLDVELDDDLLVTLSGRGDISRAMLTVVGILATGSREIDGTICHVTLDELNAITGYDAPGEISILLSDQGRIDLARQELAEAVPEGNVVITWRDVSPEIAANVEGDRVFTGALVVIVVIVVLLGIASAQLTAVLERRREFGVLAAVGMKGRQIVSLLMVEAVIIGLGGAAVTLIVGGPVTYWLATSGVNFGKMMGGDLSISGILMDPVMYGSFGSWVVWYAVGVSIASTLGATAYPAWRAARTDPAQAMRVV